MKNLSGIKRTALALMVSGSMLVFCAGGCGNSGDASDRDAAAAASEPSDDQVKLTADLVSTEEELNAFLQQCREKNAGSAEIKCSEGLYGSLVDNLLERIQYLLIEAEIDAEITCTPESKLISLQKISYTTLFTVKCSTEDAVRQALEDFMGSGRSECCLICHPGLISGLKQSGKLYYFESQAGIDGSSLLYIGNEIIRISKVREFDEAFAVLEDESQLAPLIDSFADLELNAFYIVETYDLEKKLQDGKKDFEQMLTGTRLDSYICTGKGSGVWEFKDVTYKAGP